MQDVLEILVSGMLPTLDVKELNELIEKFNNTDQDLMDFVGSVWNKAYTLGCIDGSKSNYR
jgi:hypothetical protein